MTPEPIEAVIARLRLSISPDAACIDSGVQVDIGDLSRLLDYVEGMRAGPHWRPVSEAIPQSTYLVGSSEYRGWFAVAGYSALREWRVADGQDRLPYKPTHFADLLPRPPVKGGG